MNMKPARTAGAILIIMLAVINVSSAQEIKTIQLLKPQIDRGGPLMQVLRDRKSSRDFSSKKLPLQTLSNILWAGFGINRPGTGQRTAPSAHNWQEIDIFAATADGLYLYNAKTHTLKQILAEDIRPLTGTQPFVKDAPVNLIYVADFLILGNIPDNDKILYTAANTGFISQNVYLYCASEGLATVVRGMVDRPALEKAMKLKTNQKVILAQTVGYPKE